MIRSWAWLRNLDRRRDEVLRVFREASSGPRRLLHGWRAFFMAAELWDSRDGSEGLVCHYFFGRR